MEKWQMTNTLHGINLYYVYNTHQDDTVSKVNTLRPQKKPHGFTYYMPSSSYYVLPISILFMVSSTCQVTLLI